MAHTKPKPAETKTAKSNTLRERIKIVKEAISRQSPATRANLTGRFKVN